MKETEIKTKWDEIKRNEMNEHETKTTLKRKRNGNEHDMKTERYETN